MPSKQIDRGESISARWKGWCFGGPFDRCLGPNINVSAAARESIEGAQRVLGTFESKTCRPSERKI
jgi:hypothetical protein